MGYNKESTLDFRQIVLEHIKKILEISSEELRSKTTLHTTPNMTQVEYREDTRRSYIQAIENLAYVLIPYFDENMTTCYTKCIKIINGYTFELKDVLKKEYQETKKGSNPENFDARFLITSKLKYAKELFINLNLLLNRNGYLKTSVYGDVKDEIVEDND